MLLNYILSALTKPEVASNGIELFLRLIFSAEVRKHCATCVAFGRSQAGRVSRIVSIFAVAGIAAVAAAKRQKTARGKPRVRARDPVPVASRRRRANKTAT